MEAVDLHDVPGRSGLDLADGIKNTASINRVRCADKHFSLSDTYSAIAAESFPKLNRGSLSRR
ncbi:hypothetical protein MPC4_70050 [Methylocella tundrae]|uniref:Uncharacterized protein n=1 Tax=Methylocella tundrae TaxID=227605 RepID=A0A8B6MB91_METTU|nr:hypothetical protein MPC1_2340006 [Methylocella tundrae]VTZ52162.1 hypothetical protein MPC4_70050 [Methylocella tundrae]